MTFEVDLSGDFWHLCTTPLADNSIIEPGGRGGVVRCRGWNHPQSLAEAALEMSRQTEFSSKPSRLDSAFVFLTEQEARTFARRNSSEFGCHFLYRVRLVTPEAPHHITDLRLMVPVGPYRPNWAGLYWCELASVIALPWIDGSLPRLAGVEHLPLGGLREMLTVSQLRIEQRFKLG
jgi:hypothetical protein